MKPRLLALGLLLLAAPALAESEAGSPARDRLAAAESAFAEGDFEKTLSELEAAEPLAGDDATRAAIHLLRGRCHAGYGDNERAHEEFTAALEFDPLARFDPTRIRPAIVEMLEGLRAELKSELNVRSNVSGALVLLDGKTIGVTPLRASSGIGKHVLTVRTADGLLSETRNLLVRARRTAELFVTLEEKAAAPEDPAATAPARDDEDDDYDLRPRVDTASMREAAGADEDGMRRTRFLIDLRGGGRKPFAQAMVPDRMNWGGELGLGVGGRDLFASINGAYDGADLGLTARVGARVTRLAWLFGLQGSIDLPALFLEQGFAMGAGASLGLNFAPIDLLEFHVEGSYRYFFQLPALQTQTDVPYGAQHWLVTGGLRLWL